MGRRGGSLESLLVSKLVASGKQNVYHKMMQLSTLAYLETEHDLTYVDLEGNLRCAKQRNSRRGPQRYENWPADIVVKYSEDGLNVCEIVEVETRSAGEFGKKIKTLRKKESKVEKARLAGSANAVLSDVDEVRFSIAINGLKLGENGAGEYAERIASELGKDRAQTIKRHRVYILKKDVYGLCRESMKADVTGCLRTRGGDWKTAMSGLLRSSYEDMRSSIPARRDEFYRSVDLSSR